MFENHKKVVKGVVLAWFRVVDDALILCGLVNLKAILPTVELFTFNYCAFMSKHVWYLPHQKPHNYHNV